MGRINLNQLEKVEGFPSKLGMLRSTKIYGEKFDRDWDKRWHRGEVYYKYRKQIIRGSVGKKWDEIVQKIKSKVPEGFLKKHPWMIKRPDIMKQSLEDGKWYFVDDEGSFTSVYTSKFEKADTPKQLKKNSYWDKHYLNKDGVLKWIKGKKKRKQRLNSKPLNQIKHEKKEDQIIKYLSSIADYTKVAKKVQNWNSIERLGFWEFEELKKVTFTHPTKKQERQRYDKETNSNVGTGIYDPVKITLTIPQFKLWCEKNGKTYFIFDGNEYHTNLKWSFKQ